MGVAPRGVGDEKAAALAHPPFLAALTEEGREGLATNSALRTLDVGMIRVDGSDLWPDAAQAALLEPMLAPMSLSAMLTSVAHAPPERSGRAQRAPSLKPGGMNAMANVANVLAFAEQQAKERGISLSFTGLEQS